MRSASFACQQSRSRSPAGRLPETGITSGECTLSGSAGDFGPDGPVVVFLLCYPPLILNCWPSGGRRMALPRAHRQGASGPVSVGMSDLELG